MGDRHLRLRFSRSVPDPVCCFVLATAVHLRNAKSQQEGFGFSFAKIGICKMPICDELVTEIPALQVVNL